MPPLAPTPTPSPGPTVVIDLPPDGGHTAVAHLPSDVLEQLYPHEHHTNWAEAMTGIGTVALAVGTLLLALIAFVAAIYARRQLDSARDDRNEERRSRHVETFVTVSQRWSDDQFRTVRQKIRTHFDAGGADGLMKVMVELGKAHNDEYWRLLTALDFFEDLAMLVNYDAIPIEMVDASLGTTVCQYWSMFSALTDRHRRTGKDPGWYSEFEGLSKQISDRNQYPFPWVFEGQAAATGETSNHV